MDKENIENITYGSIASVLGIISYATDVLEKIGIPDKYASIIGMVILSIGGFSLILAILKALTDLKRLFAKFFPNKKNISLSQFIIEWFFNKKKEDVQVPLFNLIYSMKEEVEDMNNVVKKIDQSKKENGIYMFYRSIFSAYLVHFVNFFNKIYKHNITIRFNLSYETVNEIYIEEYVSYGDLEDIEQLHNNKRTYLLHSCRRRQEPKDYAQNASNYYNQYDDEGYMKNSIFDYLVEKPKNYWISNNLRNDIKKGNIFMSFYNDHYKYNSLAVFRIVDYLEGYKNKDTNPNNTIGIITIESPDTNAFANKTFQDNIRSMIYMLHYAFNLININRR